MLELFKDKMYLRYWLAVVVSFLGDAMTITTVLYLIATSTSSPLMISFVFVAQLLPTIIIGPLLGPLIDKLSSKWTMVIADFYRFFIVFLMALFFNNSIMLLILVFLQAIGTAFFEPARMASIPTIVGIQRLPQGIAIFQSTLAVVKFTGPVIAGVLLISQSPRMIFIIDSLTYLLSAFFIVQLSILKKDNNAETQSYFNNIRTGMKELWNTPILRFLIMFLIPVASALGMFMTNFKAIMLQVFTLTTVQFGLMEGVFAMGTVIGAVVGSFWLKRMVHEHFLFLSTTIVGIFIISVYGFGMMDWGVVLFVLLIVWSLLVGFGNALIMVPISTIFLQHLPEKIRGMGSAIFFAIFNFLLLTGVLFGGYISGQIGIFITIIFSGIIFLGTGSTFPLYKKIYAQEMKGKVLVK